MSTDPQLQADLINPLHCYSLKDEKPKWRELAFTANLSLYGDKGLRDFLDYLDSILDQPGIGPETKAEYTKKRDEVVLTLDARMVARAEAKQERAFEYPTDFDHE